MSQAAQQSTLLFILASLLILLVWGRWRYDIVALGALFTASVFGLVPPAELFSGFGNPATITVVLVLIISYGLTRSGAVEIVLPLLEPLQTRPLLHIAALTLLAALLSMFMNNVGALALLMPIAIQSTAKAGRPPATVLMPLSFGSILGGLVTLIGTPPNILISSYRQEQTGQAFAMFDFSAVGGSVALVGISFMLLIGWRLVKVRKQSAGLELFEVEGYLFELRVNKESELIGSSVGKLKQSLREKGLDLLSLLYRKKLTKLIRVSDKQEVRATMRLMIQGGHEQVQEFANDHNLSLLSAQNSVQGVLHSEEKEIIEAVVTPQSAILGATPETIGFNSTFGVNLLAASRAGSPHRNILRHFRFKVGDVLLLHGDEEKLQAALLRMNCYPLARRSLGLGGTDKALPALLVFAAAIVAAASGLLAMQLALGLAAVAMVLFRVLPVKEFYSGIDWPVVVLLGAMIPLGNALETTGTTALLVDGILAGAGHLSPVFLLVALLIITMTVSDVLNNAATAILMAPIAYNIATALELNPDTFLMTIAIGASCAFLTPIEHQNNALVMGPGGYKFGDYWRMGLPLEILIVMVAVPALLIFWPL